MRSSRRWRTQARAGRALSGPAWTGWRDLVSAGGVSAVLAQDRDRFAREPAYLFYLREEFSEHGTALKALNDRGDGSPEGELTTGILDQIARYERLKIAERSRRGKLRKAREGKVIAAKRPHYGYCYSASRDAYEVEEETMPHSRAHLPHGRYRGRCVPGRKTYLRARRHANAGRQAPLGDSSSSAKPSATTSTSRIPETR